MRCALFCLWRCPFCPPTHVRSMASPTHALSMVARKGKAGCQTSQTGLTGHGAIQICPRIYPALPRFDYRVVRIGGSETNIWCTRTEDGGTRYIMFGWGLATVQPMPRGPRCGLVSTRSGGSWSNHGHESRCNKWWTASRNGLLQQSQSCKQSREVQSGAAGAACLPFRWLGNELWQEGRMEVQRNRPASMRGSHGINRKERKQRRGCQFKQGGHRWQKGCKAAPVPAPA